MELKFIDDFQDKLVFFYLFDYHIFDRDSIEKYYDKAGINTICKNQIIDDEFIKRHHEDINWRILSENENINILEMLENNPEYLKENLDWYMISHRKNISNSQLIKFSDHLIFEILIMNKSINLNEWIINENELIKDLENNMDMNNIIHFLLGLKTVSSNDIIKTKKKIIAAYGNLLNYDDYDICKTELFIENHCIKFAKDLKKQWKEISKYYPLTEQFIRKHINEVDIENIIKYQDLPNEFEFNIK